MESKTIIELAVHIAKAADLVCEASRRDIGFGIKAPDILHIDCMPLLRKAIVQVDIKTFYEVFGEQEYTYKHTPSGKTVEIDLGDAVVCAVVM